MGTYPVSEGARIYPDMPLYHQVFTAQFEAIRKIAKEGPCVIVGRCADYVLRNEKNLVNIFISADLPDKIKRVTEVYGIAPEKAIEVIEKTDKKRANYYKYYTEQKWGVASNYDICINSSKMGIDNTVNLLADFINKKY